jgi:catechol 2,3-dioxygenase-like lactoylglutathione lyase family enzyme
MLAAPSVQRLTAIGLVVADLDAAISFYWGGLGFRACPPRRPGGRGLRSVDRHRRRARRGGDAEPWRGVRRARPVRSTRPSIPVPRAANDPWFQHFAIRVSDMPAAYARVLGQPQIPISIGGPQQLPPSTGSVIAYKFRDADGHPLELSFVSGAPAPLPGVAPFLAIDHSAIAVADLDASLGFFVGQLGLRETERLFNQGPTQWRLDGIESALVDIVVLQPAGGGSHLELLHYRAPTSTRAPVGLVVNDIGAARLTFAVGGIGELVDRLTRNGGRSVSRRLARDDRGAAHFIVRDPDGHLIELQEQPDQHVAESASSAMTPR